MLQTYNVPAGGRQIDAKARFFRYESANAGGLDETIRVRADGQDLGIYLPGDSIELPIDCKQWIITPVTVTATCVVRLGLGRVESARLVGSVNVLGTVGISGSVTVIDAIADAVRNYNAFPALAVGAFTATALVAPGTNVNGCNVRGYKLAGQTQAGGTLSCSIAACKSAPTGFNAPAQIFEFAGLNLGASVTQQLQDSKVNKYLPAGWGLYLLSSIGGAAALSLAGFVWAEVL